MISYAESQRRIAAQARLLPIELVPLAKALGRVCASAVFSRENLPAFDNSSMDGFALAAGRLTAPLPIDGSLAAGDAPRRLARGSACEIMTGAVLPRGANAVVPVERTRRNGSSVVIDGPCAAGDFVRRAGTDFRRGQSVVDAGTVLEPRHLLALAALGVSKISVRRRPRIALIATGSELVSPSSKPRPGQIRDGSSTFLSTASDLFGAQARHFGVVRDDPRRFRSVIARALAWKPDVVLTTGAVSMGKHDFVTGEVRRLAAEVLYHKVAIRPGKPGLVARLRSGPVLFGLPGNPVSTVVGWRFFVLPFLRRSLATPPAPVERLRLAASSPKPDGLRCFFKARREAGGVRVLPGQSSHQISPLLSADCWAVLPERGTVVRAGTVVEVHPL